MFGPLTLGLLGRLHPAIAVRAQVFEQQGHPIHRLLYTAGAVGQYRAALRSGQDDHIREPGGLYPMVSDRTVEPLVAQFLAAGADELNPVESPVMTSKPVAQIITSNSCS